MPERGGGSHILWGSHSLLRLGGATGGYKGEATSWPRSQGLRALRTRRARAAEAARLKLRRSVGFIHFWASLPDSIGDRNRRPVMIVGLIAMRCSLTPGAHGLGSTRRA